MVAPSPVSAALGFTTRLCYEDTFFIMNADAGRSIGCFLWLRPAFLSFLVGKGAGHRSRTVGSTR